MQRKTWAVGALAVLVLAGTTQVAQAHNFAVGRLERRLASPIARTGPFTPPTSGPHVGHRGGTVVLDTHGLLVVERNAAAVVRADRDGKPVTTLKFAGALGEMVTDGGAVAFVADRAGNRLVRLDTSHGDALAEDGSVPVAEPYGLGLSPDGQTVYVTSVADHRLVAVDARTMTVAWSVALRAEPRGVAISPDGTRAMVGFLSSGAVAEVHLDTRGETVRWHPLDPRDHVKIEIGEDAWGGELPWAKIDEARTRFQVPTEQGRQYARNVFGLSYVGHGQVVVPHQVSTPQMKRIPSEDMQDSYGGGPESVPPIRHRIAMLAPRPLGQAAIAFSDLPAVHQPRAVAYDITRDRLFVAGYGDDEVVAYEHASQAGARSAWHLDRLTERAGRACGPDGLAVDGDHVWMHCALSRRLIRLSPDAFHPDEVSLVDDDFDDDEREERVPEWRAVRVGPALAPSVRSWKVERGAELFRRGDSGVISDNGTMACASCHPDGRQDGLSWRLGDSIVQTPMLAGRVGDTAPYKWGGMDATLPLSFAHTIERLGGGRLSEKELAALEAYVRWLPSATRPTVVDDDAVTRGRAVFEDTLACDGCHSGDSLADNNQYPFDAWGLEQTDTPSLVGLAHTAPYYHDGSAVDLWALVTDKGSVHDMADFSVLSRDQARDLVAYLESL